MTLAIGGLELTSVIPVFCCIFTGVAGGVAAVFFVPLGVPGFLLEDGVDGGDGYLPDMLMMGLG